MGTIPETKGEVWISTEAGVVPRVAVESAGYDTIIAVDIALRQ